MPYEIPNTIGVAKTGAFTLFFSEWIVGLAG